MLVLAVAPPVPQLQVLHQPVVLFLKVAMIVAGLVAGNAPATDGMLPVHVAPVSVGLLVFIRVPPTETRTLWTRKLQGGDPV